MFFSLWSRLRKTMLGLPKGNRCRAGRQPSYRPRLDPLEDRIVPTLAWSTPHVFTGAPLTASVGGHATPYTIHVAVPAAAGGLLPSGGQPSTVPNQIPVTVMENSPDTVIDLGAVFGAMSGIHHENGLQLSMLGNTNSRLVRTDLSEADLTLTYARGMYGTATITVGATDADGVSVQETIRVTVRPLASAGTGAAVPRPAGSGTHTTISTAR
jgi:hypothetical protein